MFHQIFFNMKRQVRTLLAVAFLAGLIMSCEQSDVENLSVDDLEVTSEEGTGGTSGGGGAGEDDPDPDNN